MKKVLSILLATVMLLGTVNFTAFASEENWVADTSWHNDSDASFTLDSAEKLAGLAELVNGGTSFSGKTILLGSDIDLENKAWEPIGTKDNPFKGTFDGQENTISNLSVIKEGQSNIGLFGMTTDGEIKNLTVENAVVTGRLNVGTVSGTPYTSKYTNITVTGHVEVNGMAYVGGVLGKNAYANLTGITVDVDDTSYVNANSVENGDAYRTYVGGVVGFMGEGGHIVSNVTSNIDVYGSTCDIGGITGIAHYGNTFKNIVCTGNVYMEDANETEIGGIAGVWHNESGQTVTFENCIFEGTAYIADVETEVTISGPAYGSGTGTLMQTVAKIGDTCYWTLEDAIKAAAPDGTVDVVSDITIEKWIMFAQDLTIGSGQIITLDMDGLTINGNGHSITVESIESASNGNYLFSEAENLNINDLTINIAEGVAGGISLVSGTIDNVTFNGGNGVFPGAGEVTINECAFNTANHAIYYESARDNLTVTNNTFDVGADKNVILLRGNETFTDNNIISGRTVNAVSGSPTISGNTFAEGVRLKVYNDCTATISNNTLTYIVFEDGATTSNATFAGNILNDEAREALESVGLAVVAKIGDAEYCSLHDAATDASNNDVIVILADGVSLEDADAATLTGKSVTIDLNEKELTINSATDYSDLISIPKNYKVDRTAVTDSVYTYSLKKVVIASPVGVVGGIGSSVSKPSTPSQNKTDEETKEDTKLDEDAKTDESDANKEDSTTSNTEKTTNNIVLTIGDANINVFGNTIKNDVAPKLVNDRTMLPARLIAESLGATVTWTAAEPNKVLIEKGDKVIIITIGSDIATVNGEEIKLDSPAFIENDRTYIPTRFLSEKLGATVEWVPDTTQVIITVTE